MSEAWEERFKAKYGGAKTAITEAKVAVGIAKEACQEAEDALDASLDQLARAAAEMPANLTGVRAKEPCTPCAEAAAREARGR